MAATMTPPTPILDATAEIRSAVISYQLAHVAYRATLADRTKTLTQIEEASDELDRARLRMEAAIPCKVGWYPINNRLWGWAKVDWSGLRLINKADRCPLR